MADTADDMSSHESPSDTPILSSEQDSTHEVIPDPRVELLQSNEMANTSRSSSRSSTRKKKTVGGFLAEDSDEEEDAPLPEQNSGNLQLPSINPPNRTISPSPLHNSVSQDDTLSQSDQESKPNLQRETPAIAPVVPAVPTLPSIVAPPAPTITSLPKARLPHDKMGILEDRIKEDPRGDIEAWMSLISEHRSRNKLEDARATYDRFLKLFPHAAEVWVPYIEMEIENDNFPVAENIFGRSLLSVPNVQLWSVYLNYIRRRNDLTNDMSGTARSTIAQSYDFVLSNIGIDRDSGKIWQEYIQFVRSAPGQIGGSTWQDQQKMDQMRKAYQRAITVPMANVNGLWKEYDAFEMSLNKMTGRKFLQEKSPAYMSARSANTALENITRGLIRNALPKLPPALGFEGDQEYMQQVELWKRWISWEQEDPLTLKVDELEEYKKRVLYVYKQAVMSLRFWPEIWVDAAEWCFGNGMDTNGETFLNDGIAANPESCLLAFKKADRLESNLITEDADKGLPERGAIVRAPFDKLLNTLYELLTQLKERETREIAKLEESSAVDASISAIISTTDDDEDEKEKEKKKREAAKAEKTKAIEKGYAIQSKFLWRTISFAWIALMRAMRRIQGKGIVKDPVGGSRQIFADARARGKITSDVYVASALIEHHVYKDPAGTKIFERGAKLFPEDEAFTLEYLKHLLSIGDTTNARVAFETTVSRLTQKGPEFIPKTKPLYSFFHKYESQYGELSQISKLEKRMAELFPEDPNLIRFASRFTAEGFDPTAARLVISPATQLRPKSLMQSIENHVPVQDSPRPQFAHQENSPRPQFLQTTNSPKRPFPTEDFESELNRPRKIPRGESPLKGAAGRRLNQQKQLQQSHGTPSWQSNAPPFVVPRDITFLLSIIPRSEFYNATKFSAESLVQLLSQTNVPDYSTWKASMDQNQGQSQYQAPQPQPQQPQRYDGTKSSYTQPSNPNSSSWPSTSQAYSGQGQVSSWASNTAGTNYGTAPYTQGYYSSGVQAQAEQPYIPAPEPVHSGWQHNGYPNMPLPGSSIGGPGRPIEAPYLAPGNNWYQEVAPANGAPPGYNYGR